ncbi:MAG TPA: hypothetical protein VG672_17830 [Bryobacteraceae bacterium]|jgi:hypothetical protein|nr:hypothetical protein [Bryobacteraceae bacterium]
MKNVRLFSLSVFCGLWCAAAGEQPKELAPSPLEAFAARPTAAVIWSRHIGRLETRYSQATFTAVIVEDRTATPSLMRGVRIDLAHVGGTPNCDWRYTAWRIM